LNQPEDPIRLKVPQTHRIEGFARDQIGQALRRAEYVRPIRAIDRAILPGARDPNKLCKQMPEAPMCATFSDRVFRL